MTDYTPTGIITVAGESGEFTPTHFVGSGYTMGTGLDYSGGMAAPGFTITTLVNNIRSRPTVGLAWPTRA